AADVNPVPELLDAHLALLLGHADLAERISELRARQADQRGPRGRDIALQRGLLDEAARLSCLQEGGHFSRNIGGDEDACHRSFRGRAISAFTRVCDALWRGARNP